MEIDLAIVAILFTSEMCAGRVLMDVPESVAFHLVRRTFNAAEGLTIAGLFVTHEATAFLTVALEKCYSVK